MAMIRLSPRRTLWRPVVGASLLLAAALSVPQVIGLQLAASPLAIHVSGNHLVDGAGSTVTLHGADLSGTEFACDQSGGPTSRGWSIYGGQPLGQLSTYQAMAAWNIDVVRVPLNEDCWLGINGVNPAYAGTNYQAAIATEVSLIHQAGMIAILDLHWNAPGAWAAVAQQPMADADHSIAFWQSVASYFKSDPALIFDLYNEPFLYGSYFTNASQDPWQCWLDGCSLNQFVSGDQVGPSGQTTGYTTSYTWQTAGMQQLINAIRGTGAGQPILVNGVDWANDDSGWLSHAPQDPAGQLIAGAHDYPGETCQTTSCWDSQQAPISASYPFLVGETGDHTAAPVTFLPTFLPYADSHGWSYLAWTWNPWGYTDDVLITDWSGTPNAGEGSYYKQHLLALGPTPFATPSGTTSPTASPSPSASPTPASRIKGGVDGEPAMRPWRYAGANPQSWWCVMPNCSPDYTNGGQGPMPTAVHEMQEAKAVGASAMRLSVDWPLVEPARGTYDWSRFDALIQAANQVGLTMVPDFLYTPQWAGGGSQLNVPATAISDWTGFVTAVLQRYPGQFPLGVQIWNEPDTGSSLYNGSAATYVSQILNPAYTAVKAVDPTMPVIEAASANDAGACCSFLSAVLAAGGRFDVATYDNYAGTWNSEAAAYRATLDAAGRASTPIWMTEFGVQSTTGNQSAALQQVLGGSEPLQMAFWYNLRDSAAWSCCPPVNQDQAYWGLLNANFSPKPAYATLQALLLGSAVPVPSPSPNPTPNPTATPTPTVSASSTPTPTPRSTPTPSGSEGHHGRNPSPQPQPLPPVLTLPYADTFASDSPGSVPAGWQVSGQNAGFAVAATDSPYGHVYAHNGSTASTVGGSAAWTNYTVTVEVRPSAWSSEDGSVDFRYVDGDHHYAVRLLSGSEVELVRADGGSTTELAQVTTHYSSTWHQLSIQADGSSLTVNLDGTTIMTATDSTFASGAIGFAANDPIDFADVSVTSL